jgi:hypothetical protein
VANLHEETFTFTAFVARATLTQLPSPDNRTIVVKFTEVRVRLPVAEASTADCPDRTAAENATLDIDTDPPSADTNTNASVAPAVLGAKLQLVSDREDPVHRSSDVCDPPSDVPTTNFSCENAEE